MRQTDLVLAEFAKDPDVYMNAIKIAERLEKAGLPLRKRKVPTLRAVIHRLAKANKIEHTECSMHSMRGYYKLTNR